MPIIVDGSELGGAISLGHRYVFFTTDQALKTFDGGYFSCLEEIIESLRQIVRRNQGSVKSNCVLSGFRGP